MLTVFRIRAFSAWHDTRGIVLPLTFFILVLLAGLVAALLSMGAMETQISANLLRSTQGFNLAEAGAERALAQFVADSSFVGNATCSPCPGTVKTTLWTNQTLGSVGTYTVKYWPIGPSTVLVQATGQSSIGTVTQNIQMVVTAPPAGLPYAIVGGDVNLFGTVEILNDVNGNGGSVYGLTDADASGLTGSGTGCVAGNGCVAKTVTSTGTCEGCASASHIGNVAGSGGLKPAQPLPTTGPLDYKQYADFIMGGSTTAGSVCSGVAVPDHQILVVATCTLVAENAGQFSGWTMSNSKPGDWHYSGGTAPANGTYYSIQELSIDKPVGVSAANPWKATLLTGDGLNSGELEINGGANQHIYIAPACQSSLGCNSPISDILLAAGVIAIGSKADASKTPATDSDIIATLTGTIVATNNTAGRTGPFGCTPAPCDNGHSSRAVSIAAHTTINGQILSDGVVGLAGNAQITYKAAGGAGGAGAPQIISWTRVAQ